MNTAGSVLLDTNVVVAYIRDFPASAVVLFPDQATSEHYGQIKAELAQMGRPIPDNDLRIAAIARQQGLPPATRDAHFAHVPGLQTLAWQTHQPVKLFFGAGAVHGVPSFR